MKTLVDTRIPISEKVFLTKRLMKRETTEEYQERLKWSFQVHYYNGKEWLPICRIDNYRHKGEVASHIHTFRPERVRWRELTFIEAEQEVKEMSKRILKSEFNEDIEFR